MGARGGHAGSKARHAGRNRTGPPLRTLEAGDRAAFKPLNVRIHAKMGARAPARLRPAYRTAVWMTIGPNRGMSGAGLPLPDRRCGVGSPGRVAGRGGWVEYPWRASGRGRRLCSRQCSLPYYRNVTVQLSQKWHEHARASSIAASERSMTARARPMRGVGRAPVAGPGGFVCPSEWPRSENPRP